MMKVMLVDDHNIIRIGLQWLLEKSGDFPVQVTISCDSAKKAIQMARKDPPDLAIVDISMPGGMDGIECTDQLRAWLPDLPILVLSMHNEPQYALHAFECGASGYLTKKAITTELFTAIKAVYSGRRYLPQEIKDAIAMTAADGRDCRNLVKSLSKREFQVMTNLVQGVTNREIANNYNLSTKTVDTYRTRILHKLEVRNNVELTHFAVRHGLC
jgi:two-component system invasion response regulator UvrY